ncbi:MAG: 7TM diverse intracellular signaling domain-containing protein, partial [Campylobacterota bacterium]|nr:7TM diverse intracellular signaling domain-containing protein [Campylobacterota bacterium]
MFVRIFLLLFFYLQFASANLIVTDSTSKYTDFSISYFFDETDSMDIEDVSKTHFTQNIPSQFTLGYHDKNIWFKIKIKNTSETNSFVLQFTEPFWNKFNLYQQTSNGYLKQEAGLLSPLKKREIEDASPAFAITINKGEIKTLYINGQTVNGYLGAFNLYTAKEFFRPSRITLNTFYQLYSGILLIIIILNFLLLIEMRERIYAYYIGYVSAYIIFVSMFSSSYLYLGFSGWNHGLHTMGSIVLMFLSLFSGAFLELDKYFPKIDRLFKLITMIFIIFAVLMNFNIPNFTLIFNIFAFIFMTLLLIMAIKTWQLGKIKTKYYLYALIIYMPTMGMMALTFNAFVGNNDFTRYSFLLGALIELIFFSLILASRFHVAKYDKIRFQKKLLLVKQKNEEYLKEEIKKQHSELEKQSTLLIQQSRQAQMGEMISMIAHQWRQPLSAISATSGNMQVKIILEDFDLSKEEDRDKCSQYFLNKLENIDGF